MRISFAGHLGRKPTIPVGLVFGAQALAIIGFIVVYVVAAGNLFQAWAAHRQLELAQRQDARETAREEEARRDRESAAQAQAAAKAEAAKRPLLEFYLVRPSQFGAPKSPVRIVGAYLGTCREYTLEFFVENEGDREAPSFRVDVYIPAPYEIVKQSASYHPDLKTACNYRFNDARYQRISYNEVDRIDPGEIRRVGEVLIRTRHDVDARNDDIATLKWQIYSRRHGFAFPSGEPASLDIRLAH